MLKKIIFLRHSLFLFCLPVALFSTENSSFIFYDYDFDTAMYTTMQYKHYYERILTDEHEKNFINLCKNHYNFFRYHQNDLWSKEPRIPKIIHQIWLGPKPFPKKYKKLSKTWIKKHRDWHYKLWTDQDVESFALINREFYNKTESWAEKANLLRYEILYQYGGLYIDTDFQCLASLDTLHHCCDFYAGLEYPPKSYNSFIIGNALIGARQGHIILAMLIENIKYQWKSFETWTRINQLERSGTRYFSATVKKMVGESNEFTVIFPANIFYPFSGKTFIIPPESFGIHYWDSSWLKEN